MNESIRVHYTVQVPNDNGYREYIFNHPYGAPADEAFFALEAIRSQIERRVTEIQNAQLAAQGQAPVIELPAAEESTEGLTHGN